MLPPDLIPLMTSAFRIGALNTNNRGSSFKKSWKCNCEIVGRKTVFEDDDREPVVVVCVVRKVAGTITGRFVEGTEAP